MDNSDLLARIRDLHDEEHRLHATMPAAPYGNTAALSAIERELDQLWDLLRRRKALAEYGQDPRAATVRPAAVVAAYQN
ncbi:DUF2630 family protein [Streptomyces sp. VRA16 Mangrove soil]|nr:DUF2630 family protein [Streptomyces sp. VRA16 Mangrove soil]